LQAALNLVIAQGRRRNRRDGIGSGEKAAQDFAILIP
jgi:hypothetical protein